MDLQNIFYTTAIIFFLVLGILIFYIFYLVIKFKHQIDLVTEKAKETSKNFIIARYGVKAGLLKLFISLLGSKKGGEEI